MMGGPAKVLEEAGKAFDRKEYQWSAELASLLVTRDTQDMPAREAKAKAFVELAIPQTNPNWRSWYLTAANELRNIFPRATTSAVGGGLTSPGIVEALPYETWVSQWSLRLKAEETIANNVHQSMGFFFQPAAKNQTTEGFVLRVRRGVAELIATGPDRKDVAALSAFYIEMDKATEGKLIHADVAGKDYDFDKVLPEQMANGNIKVYGGKPEQVVAFFNLFDRLPATMQPLAVR
jgi:alkyl sulfatase BDS1-like metallo-beta-lactamase superfamily hydrolase